MEAPKEIYLREYINQSKLDDNWQTISIESQYVRAIKYIRADLAELTWHDMKLAYRSVNAALDECDGKTMQEVMEMALIIFTEKRKDKR